MIKAVVFDIDNTIYSYSPCDNAGIRQMYNTYVSKCSKECSFCEFEQLLHTAKRDVKKHTAGTAASHNRMLYAQRICELSDCLNSDNVIALYNAYWNSFLRTMRLYTHVLDVFEFLKSIDIHIGFCTDLTVNIQMRKLVKLGIPDIADAIVTSEESGAEKPSPIPFKMILDKLEVLPEQTIMIGDDYNKDIKGALNVGMHAVEMGENHNYQLHVNDYFELDTLLRKIII